MSTAPPTSLPRPLPRRRPGSGSAVIRHAARLVIRGAGVLVVLTAGMSGLVVWQYRSLYGDSFDASSLAALAENPAIRVLFGTPVALDTAGGFTVWRTGTPMMVLVSVWALLTMTRLTRGDEEAGRWDALLAGRWSIAGILGRYLATVIAVTGFVGVAVAGAMEAAGATGSGAARYGAALFLAGAGGAALGGLAAQLVADRRRAVTLATAVLGAGLAARMVGDGVDGWSWLLWASPFGLLSLAEPFGANRTAPLLVLLGGVLVLAAAGLLSARRRDLHAGLVRGAGLRPARTTLLGSAGRFAVRRAQGSVAAWGVGVAAYFLLIGGLASTLTKFLADNPRYAELAAQAGFGGLETVEGYVAALFVLLAIPVSLFAASRISTDSADEEAGRLALVFATPTTRDGWFLTNATVTLTGGLLLAAGAGLATWLGTTLVGAPLSLTNALAGAFNVTPVLLLSLGCALLALGWAPRAVFAIGAIPSAGGFLLQALADSLQWPRAVRALSPFDHLNAVPAEAPDWAAAAAMALIGVALAAIGLLGYRRRDLQA